MIEIDLTKEEKRKLRKAAIGRLIVFFLFILPIIVFTFYILYLVLMSFVDGSQDMFSYAIPILFVLFYLGGARFILPQYKNLFKYGNARTKQIIETTVLDIFHFYNGNMISFQIKTDYRTINTAKNVVFFWDVSALKIVKGMDLYLHIIPGMENEILRISAK